MNTTLTETELKMLELIVANKGDIEQAQLDYAAVLRGQLISQAGGTTDADMMAIINDTVDRKIRNLIPAIGTAFIKQGKALGGKVRNSINKEIA